MKDYYKILELEPHATISEVKKNFRRLALRYHPDTNQGNHYAEAWYHEIQEAYKTLTDTELREAYLQDRWLFKSQGRPFFKTIPLTPPFILKQAIELQEQVRSMDHFRMSHQTLQQQILFTLTNDNINVLLSYNDININRQIAAAVIASMLPLEYPLMKLVTKQLYKLAGTDEFTLQLVKRYDEKRKQQFIWEKYQGLIIFIITLLLCAVIFYMGEK